MLARIARIFLAVGLPVIFLWLFFRSIEPSEVAHAVEGVGAGWLLLILAALIQVLEPA